MLDWESKIGSETSSSDSSIVPHTVLDSRKAISIDMASVAVTAPVRYEWRISQKSSRNAETLTKALNINLLSML